MAPMNEEVFVFLRQCQGIEKVESLTDKSQFFSYSVKNCAYGRYTKFRPV